MAIGLGGRVELWNDEIRIIKGGVFGHLAELLWLGYGLGQSTLFIAGITAVEIVRSMILPDFIRFSYAGSPPLTGDYAHDALAENALIMNVFDNRKFYDLKEAVDAQIVGRPAGDRMMGRHGRRRAASGDRGR